MCHEARTDRLALNKPGHGSKNEISGAFGQFWSSLNLGEFHVHFAACAPGLIIGFSYHLPTSKSAAVTAPGLLCWLPTPLRVHLCLSAGRNVLETYIAKPSLLESLGSPSQTTDGKGLLQKIMSQVNPGSLRAAPLAFGSRARPLGAWKNYLVTPYHNNPQVSVQHLPEEQDLGETRHGLLTPQVCLSLQQTLQPYLTFSHLIHPSDCKQSCRRKKGSVYVLGSTPRSSQSTLAGSKVAILPQG